MKFIHWILNNCNKNLHFPFGDTSTLTIPNEWPAKLCKWVNLSSSTRQTLTSVSGFPMAPDTIKSYSSLAGGFSFGGSSGFSWLLSSVSSSTSGLKCPQAQVLHKKFFLFTNQIFLCDEVKIEIFMTYQIEPLCANSSLCSTENWK